MNSISRNQTISTYDRIALQYLERRKDRSPIEHHLDLFANLMAERNLDHLPVIDVGCGPGFDTVALEVRGLRCFGLDLSWGMLTAARRYFPGSYTMADMVTLPLKENIGGIWSCAAMLHLTRSGFDKALHECSRVLVPGGVLYFSVKEGDGERWSSNTAGQPGSRFFTLWQPSSLDRLVTNAGFRIIEATIEATPEGTEWLVRFAERIP